MPSPFCSLKQSLYLFHSLSNKTLDTTLHCHPPKCTHRYFFRPPLVFILDSPLPSYVNRSSQFHSFMTHLSSFSAVYIFIKIMISCMHVRRMASNSSSPPSRQHGSHFNPHQQLAPEKPDADVSGTLESDRAEGVPQAAGIAHPHFGTVAQRALFSSNQRRGRKVRKKDAKSLPSRLSKMSIADDSED